MTSELELFDPIAVTPESPFDAIKHVREDGKEYWSARELMPLLGYGKWERFSGVVERAMQAARNLGHDLLRHFAQVTQLPGAGNLGDQQKQDFHLSRFAAYLVAMNGDPRKPEVAAAQAYFAVKTREAEVRPSRELTEEEIVQRALQITTQKVAALEAKIDADRPMVERAKNHASGIGLKTRTQFFREVKQWAHAQHGIEVKREHVLDFLSTRKLGIFVRGNRSDEGEATAWAIEKGYAENKDGTAENGHNFITGKLKPKGQEYAWERIARFLEANGTLELPRQIGGNE